MRKYPSCPQSLPQINPLSLCAAMSLYISLGFLSSVFIEDGFTLSFTFEILSTPERLTGDPPHYLFSSTLAHRSEESPSLCKQFVQILIQQRALRFIIMEFSVLFLIQKVISEILLVLDLSLSKGKTKSVSGVVSSTDQNG